MLRIWSNFLLSAVSFVPLRCTKGCRCHQGYGVLIILLIELLKYLTATGCPPFNFKSSGLNEQSSKFKIR
jgi:hypothetical protein